MNPDRATSADLLPTSSCKVTRNVVIRGGMAWAPIFCANCGKDGGLVPDFPEVKANAFYLCVPCAEVWSPLVDTMMVSDEVFWQKMIAAQVEADGRVLTPLEQIEALKNSDHYLTKLARERYDQK